MSETSTVKNLDTEPRPVLGTLMSGESVIDRPDSHTHVDGELLARAISYINAKNRNFLAEEVYMGEEIGESTCVETTDEDVIVEAYRPHRAGPTRFVMNREAMPTDTMSVILLRAEEQDTMVLISAWIGNMSEPEPWDKKATPKSGEFWSNHALIWGSQAIDGTKPVKKL